MADNSKDVEKILMTIEHTILSNLALNEDYGRKVLPFLKAEYFFNNEHRHAFQLIIDYISKYNSFPSREALLIDLSNNNKLNENEYKKVQEILSDLKTDSKTDLAWLVDQTEKFCQNKAIYNGLMQSVKIVNDQNSDGVAVGAIPKILSDALSVSFNVNIGHDFLEQWEQRYDQYHQSVKRLSFDLSMLNKITKGGFPPCSLNVWLAGTGVGKTLILCHCAAADLSVGRNVLYITAEMGEIGDPSITQRIDANLLDIPVDQLSKIQKSTFQSKVATLTSKTNGKLIVKEYPTASAGSNHFKALLNELKLKKKFVPDIIYVDYLNICISSRLKFGRTVNSYEYVKSIAEELRGMGQEFHVPVVTATQTNREGYSSSDAGLENTAESFGLPMTADFMALITTNEQLKTLGQYAIKQLKNRYSNIADNPKFVIGVDYSKMRLFDVEQSAQTLQPDVVDNNQQFFGTKSKTPNFDGFR